MISEDLRNIAQQFSKIDTEDNTAVVDSIWLKTISRIIADLADQANVLEARSVPTNERMDIMPHNVVRIADVHENRNATTDGGSDGR